MRKKVRHYAVSASRKTIPNRRERVKGGMKEETLSVSCRWRWGRRAEGKRRSAGNFIKFVISLRNWVKGAPLFRDKLAPPLKRPTVDTDAIPENQTKPCNLPGITCLRATEDLSYESRARCTTSIRDLVVVIDVSLFSRG